MLNNDFEKCLTEKLKRRRSIWLIALILWVTSLIMDFSNISYFLWILSAVLIPVSIWQILRINKKLKSRLEKRK